MKKSFLMMSAILSVSCHVFAGHDKNIPYTNGGTDFGNVISDYRKALSQKPVAYKLINEKMLGNVKLKHYQMSSQTWSPGAAIHPDLWEHNVDIYIPQKPESRSALIVINNGTNYDSATPAAPGDFSEDQLKQIASVSHTIVIAVSNEPNQPLHFRGEAVGLKEDDLVARSWMSFLSHPEGNHLMPVHIPMAAAVSQSIRVAKDELKPWGINKFVLTGISKRGWTAWLTTLTDPDVVAVIPFVIDLLNTKVSLEHMYRSYGNNWPGAFNAYYQQGVDKKIREKAFESLMKIEDPLQYRDEKYLKRLAVQKYIINASGDDFYVPDNARFYYDQLPGEKSLRVAPNTDHYGIKNFSEQSVISFLNRFQRNMEIPSVESKLTGRVLTASFSEKPLKITRWTANNPTSRDFRYACHVRFTPTVVATGAGDRVSVSVNDKAVGWEATYLEATFKDGFIATTQVYITPDTRYPQTAPPSAGARCQTLPGRGLGVDANVYERDSSLR